MRNFCLLFSRRMMSASEIRDSEAAIGPYFFLVSLYDHIERDINHLIDVQRVVDCDLPYLRILFAVHDKRRRHPVFYGRLTSVAEVEASSFGLFRNLGFYRPVASEQSAEPRADVVFWLSHVNNLINLFMVIF